ncbi:hypothetical protein L228DRAFT_246515 [Xylona heveae TC161]|uniref:Methyltransferase type 11 domain-containing protein n=1 Tax=Xylona heveae (strain CBS 132557 / TC161) TaxID=1328760 RepID=A0A161TCZ1_XYLHT|nr:hypothetical protein L228DRAFT_246515 [Xylona heveae TC161]KZF23677.1 hypothetical protein L228DRAFT_246515 [Xylona heveae TC161]
MESSHLPTTTYESPRPGQARHPRLNTIIEDVFQCDIRPFLRDGNGTPIDKPTLIISPPSIESVPTLCHGGVLTTSNSPESAASISPESPWNNRRHGSRSTQFMQAEQQQSLNVDLSEDKLLPKTGSPVFNPHRNRYPSLTIPTWSTSPHTNECHKSSPVPPTPPPKIPMSPAALSFLSRDLPAANATPSLDGSVTSEQMANLSAPATPDSTMKMSEVQDWGMSTPNSTAGQGRSNQDGLREQYLLSPVDYHARLPRRHTVEVLSAEEDMHPLEQITEEDSDVHSLEHLSRESPIELSQGLTDDKWDDTNNVPAEKEPEMEQVSAIDFYRYAPKTPSAASRASLGALTQLSIPSPRDFFASLEPGTRHTWAPKSPHPPSSATAERFYGYPWLREEEKMPEHIVGSVEQIREPEVVEIQMEPEELAKLTSTLKEQPFHDFDENYERGLRQLASANLDRTSSWLVAQTTYLNALREAPAPEDDENVANEHNLPSESAPKATEPVVKKSVRFQEDIQPEPMERRPLPKIPGDSLYYHAFQHLIRTAGRLDAFTYQQARIEALRAARISLPSAYRDQLLGLYYLVDPITRPLLRRPISLMPPPGHPQEGDSPEKKIIERKERESQALDQIRFSTWNVQALKMLNGGHLLMSPARKLLARSKTTPQAKDTPRNRARVLDLGGQSTCDWAWLCALEYRQVKTYTVLSKEQAGNETCRSPFNHRRVTVPHLWKLPFRDNFFDVISARSLYMFLKTDRPPEQMADEYDLCLKECLRCLKPGGYLEFMVMDSDIIRAGPRAMATSVEFGFNLKTRGYESTPTRSWIGRLKNAGFGQVKRAWLFLPLAAAPPANPPQAPQDEKADVANTGNTAHVAGLTGLVGTLAWERWMLKLHMEMGKSEERLLEGINSIVAEGEQTGAGWRCLTGWARKPTGKAALRK